ncbi:hypothetical protein BAMA_18245 [Bacillus manliponensis]|uniref:Uncharacterized protein n=2 Tax=Bacillus manliponensis TaxID=574376 RepID=A0A073K4E4_9BACI|nr:hypothetical protein [Bacillus manliponensis]KEK17153.1 hypothetical protein BAMA_18245 [Bacillus manliponensis]
MNAAQLSFEDRLGKHDYAATSTAEQFLRRGKEVYEVHFYDKDDKQRIDWFEAIDKETAESEAAAEHGRIRIIKTDVSARTLAEIMSLD